MPRLKFMNVSKIAPNRVCCNALLAAYARAKPPQWEKALALLTAMCEAAGEVAPDTVSYNTALKACGNALRLDHAFKVFGSMRQRGVLPSITTFGTLITAASDAGSYPAVKQESGLDINTACMNAFVAALVKQGQWEEARLAFRAMLGPASRTRPSIITFNTIMAAYMRQGHYEQVREVFEDMYAAGLQPSVVTFNTLITAHAHRGAWVDALDVLHHMYRQQGHGVMPNTITYNSVLAALNTGAMLAPPAELLIIATRALGVFDQLAGMPGVLADLTTFNTLIAVLARTGQWQKALAIYDLMTSQGFMHDAGTASALILAYCQGRHLQAALRVWAWLRSSGLEADLPACNALLEASAESGAWEQALQIFEAMHTSKTPPDARSFNILLTALREAGQVERALQLVDLLRASPAIPDRTTYGLIIALLEQRGNWAQVLDLLEEMVTRRLTPDVATMNAVLTSLQRDQQADLSYQLLCWMVAGAGVQVVPNVESYHIIMETMIQSRRTVVAVRLCAAGHERGTLSHYSLTAHPVPQSAGYPAVLNPNAGPAATHAMPPQAFGYPGDFRRLPQANRSAYHPGNIPSASHGYGGSSRGSGGLSAHSGRSGFLNQSMPFDAQGLHGQYPPVVANAMMQRISSPPRGLGAVGKSSAGQLLGGVVDLQGCTTQVAVVVVLTWLARMAELSGQGQKLGREGTKIATGWNQHRADARHSHVLEAVVKLFSAAPARSLPYLEALLPPGTVEAPAMERAMNWESSTMLEVPATAVHTWIQCWGACLNEALDAGSEAAA
ncbi:hypothetical protein WJX72_009549 [[Myrmecia] bisecta]|uniref:Pentatricopeptide repeat-containing protein-mitochondrial domain-containing protein n=1 Tax=[Myrmecia] bisecta TaxID=41462 RepID=A0AAW1PPR9_9CHLO